MYVYIFLQEARSLGLKKHVKKEASIYAERSHKTSFHIKYGL